MLYIDSYVFTVFNPSYHPKVGYKLQLYVAYYTTLVCFFTTFGL